MKAAYVRGHHFTEYVEEVKSLKRVGRLAELEQLLIELVDATEDENRRRGGGVAPWYYEQAAKLYRRQRAYNKEVGILERFARQRHAPGAGPDRLRTRLEKARSLLRSM